MIGNPRAVPFFLEALSSPDFKVRTACLRGLFKLAGDDVAVTALTDALRDPHQEVRKAAVMFLGRKDCAGSVSALLKGLRDESASVRKAAVAALANLKNEAAIPALITLLGDRELDVRGKALDALRMIAGEDISFDVLASGPALAQQINELRNRWCPQRPDSRGAELVETPAAAAFEAAPELEKPESAAAQESAEPDAAAFGIAPAEFAGRTKESLMKMSKSELLELCEKRGIPCSDKKTKDEITNSILEQDDEGSGQ